MGSGHETTRMPRRVRSANPPHKRDVGLVRLYWEALTIGYRPLYVRAVNCGTKGPSDKTLVNCMKDTKALYGAFC